MILGLKAFGASIDGSNRPADITTGPNTNGASRDGEKIVGDRVSCFKRRFQEEESPVAILLMAPIGIASL